MTTPKQWRAAEKAVFAQLTERGVVESDHYEDWKQGDLVSITGEAGVFNFLSVRLDEYGNPRWANVYGGPKGQEMHRSFNLNRLETFSKIKRRGSKKVAGTDGA